MTRWSGSTSASRCPSPTAARSFPAGARARADAKALWALVDRLCRDDPHLAATSFVDHPEASRLFPPPRRARGRALPCARRRPPARALPRHRARASGDGLQALLELQPRRRGASRQVEPDRHARAAPARRAPAGVAVRSAAARGSVVVEIYTAIAAMAGGRAPGRSKMQHLAELNAGALRAWQSAASGAARSTITAPTPCSPRPGCARRPARGLVAAARDDAGARAQRKAGRSARADAAAPRQIDHCRLRRLVREQRPGFVAGPCGTRGGSADKTRIRNRLFPCVSHPLVAPPSAGSRSPSALRQLLAPRKIASDCAGTPEGKNVVRGFGAREIAGRRGRYWPSRAAPFRCLRARPAMRSTSAPPAWRRGAPAAASEPWRWPRSRPSPRSSRSTCWWPARWRVPDGSGPFGPACRKAAGGGRLSSVGRAPDL